MDVLQINRDTSKCLNDVVVYWGMKYDTIGFLFNDKILLFTLDGSSQFKHQISYQSNRILYLVQDYRKEQYSIDIVWNDGVLIFVSNIDYGIPSYVFCMNCNLCDL